jgi:hypothetical protein
VRVAINARSRRARSVVAGMQSSSLRHWAPSRTGVLPVLTTCFGPRTSDAGLVGTTWPVTSEPNSIRTAASCCFTDGAEASFWSCSNIGGDIVRLDRGDKRAMEVISGNRLKPGD